MKYYNNLARSIVSWQKPKADAFFPEVCRQQRCKTVWERWSLGEFFWTKASYHGSMQLLFVLFFYIAFISSLITNALPRQDFLGRMKICYEHVRKLGLIGDTYETICKFERVAITSHPRTGEPWICVDHTSICTCRRNSVWHPKKTAAATWVFPEIVVPPNHPF